MEISVVSKQYIKPSSPTQRHLATLNPSFLDQLPLAPFALVVIFYPEGPPIDSLKSSLAETLNLFYPLAGAIKEDAITVDINDQGAYFVETRVKGRMKDLLARPDQHLVNQLFPPTADMLKSARVTNVQANSFECGGFAIACCLRHVHTDVNSLANFLKAWAGATSKACGGGGDGNIVSPDFIAPTLFSVNSDDTGIRDTMSAMRAPFAVGGNFAKKRFLFNPNSLKKLQEEAVRESGRRPTRFEAVSACLWRSFIKASLSSKGDDDPKSTVLMLPMNLRRRASTLPINDHSMGNIVLHTWAKQLESELTTHSHSVRLSLLAQKIREAVGKVDSAMVARMSSDGADALKSLLGDLSEKLAGCGDLLLISSWCGFGLYDVNFGKGKPVWAAPGFLVDPGNKICHVSLLFDASDGGVEAWFFSSEAYMDSVVSDLELHEVAVVDPSHADLGN